MGRRRAFSELSLLMAAVLCGTACAPRTPHSDVSIPGVIGAPPGAVAATEHVENVSVDPAAAGRIRGLEQQLAAQDRRIATVRGEIDAARSGVTGEAPAPAAQGQQSTASAGATQQATQPSVASSAAALAPADPPAPSPVAAPAAAAPADLSHNAGVTAAAANVSPSSDKPAPGLTQAGSSSVDPRLLDAQRRIARLERMLAAEVQRRQEVEAEMNRLLQETSAGPYDQATSVVEKHLREQLDRARREIANLRTSLASERRSHDEVERRFAALQAQLQSAPAGDAPPGARSEEMEALKERQRRVLASIQQDLAASKQREVELRQALETAQGNGGASLADTVSGLRTENSALQLRLDEEHQRNAALNAKVQLAKRVADLIFRMQNNGTLPVAAAALPAAP